MTPRAIYGLGLEANVPIAALGGLDPSGSADVSVTIGALPAAVSTATAQPYYASDELDEDGEPTIRVSTLEGGAFYRFHYQDGTQVVVDGRGERVWACGPAGACVEDTATYLLGPVLGFVLRLRGTACLHASAVVVDGRALALVGPAGAGKSSTAAAFARRGHAILADDVAPLEDRGDSFRIHPAYPRLRLWPDSAEAMFGAQGPLPRIVDSWDKRYLDLNGPNYRFQREAVELAAIYLLEERSDAAMVSPMTPREALVRLVANTCAGRLLPPARRVEEFDLLSRLVSRVPVRRVACADGFGRIDEAYEMLTRDFRATAALRG